MGQPERGAAPLQAVFGQVPVFFVVEVLGAAVAGFVCVCVPSCMCRAGCMLLLP